MGLFGDIFGDVEGSFGYLKEDGYGDHYSDEEYERETAKYNDPAYVPDHDILFEDIKPSPLSDTSTYGWAPDEDEEEDDEE